VDLLGVAVIVAIALGFDYTNGFHDSANAIATTISTRAMTPRAALAMAAVANVVGALLSTGVAKTIGGGIITAPKDTKGLVLVFAALVGAIVWNLITWYFGLPSSSSHALIGGLVGAALASAGSVKWSGVIDKVVVPMVVSPLVGFVLAYLVMLATLWIVRNGKPSKLNRGFRVLQVVSGATMAFGHGTQDAQKTMGVITLALVVAGYEQSFDIPLWVILSAAAAISLGTYSGGWRIMRTLGRRVVKIDPVGGFAAQTTASAVMLTTAYVYAAPISTTHVITSSVMGVGATRRFSAVRWGVAGNIVTAWVLTIPAAAIVAAAVYWVTHLLLQL
jgi:PiT family inorganic phosphate transporter